SLSNATALVQSYSLSLHDALPIYISRSGRHRRGIEQNSRGYCLRNYPAKFLFQVASPAYINHSGTPSNSVAVLVIFQEMFSSGLNSMVLHPRSIPEQTFWDHFYPSRSPTKNGSGWVW